MNRAPYELALESQISGARSTYRLSTADGVHSKQQLRTAELLLVETLWGCDLGNFLTLEANYGVIGIVLAEHATAVHMTESSARAAHLCERNAAPNDAEVTVTIVADSTELDVLFDTVAYAPKPYTPLVVGKQFMANAFRTLRPGGRFYLAASKQTGLTSYEECLHQLALDVERHATHNGCHLLRATRPLSIEPPTYVSPREIAPVVNGTELTLVSVPGLFSASRLDDGTRLLLETTTIEDGEAILDVCCGYGAIGTYAAKNAACEVWLSDDNRIATCCAERSLHASGVEGTIVTADCVEGVTGQTFDRVLCNPPTHAGRGVLSELFAGIIEVLAPGGELTLVHHCDLDLSTYVSPFSSVEQQVLEEEHQVLRLTH